MEERPRKKRGRLYYHSDFRSNRCIWLLRELNVLEDFDLIDVDVWDKDSKERQEYTDNVHPHTTVPALEYNNQVILESGAICMFIAQTYPGSIPEDLLEYYNLMFYVCATVDEVQERLFVQYFFKEPNGTEDKDEIEQAMKKFETCLDYISSKLKHGPYICGQKFTVVDCVLGYNMWWASVMKDGLLLKNHPDLNGYLDRLRKRPAFQLTFETNK